MALTYKLDSIADWETVCFLEAPADEPTRGLIKGDRVINPLTEVLIFATMATGIGQLTEDNADEFYARLNFLERTDGPFIIRAEVDGKRPEGAAARITPEEIRAHIGLSTNATFRDESRTKWMGRFKTDLDASKRRYQQAAAKAVAA